MKKQKLSKNQGKPEIKNPIIIEAEFIRSSRNSICVNYGGELEWFKKYEVIIDLKCNTLTVSKDTLKRKFPNEKF